MSFNHLPHKVIVGPAAGLISLQSWISDNLVLAWYDDYVIESIWMGNHVDSNHEFMFRREEDAMAFKLAWV